MNFSDPPVRFVSQFVLLFACMVMVLIATLSAGIVADWYLNNQDGPGDENLVLIAESLPSLSGTEADEVFNIFGAFLMAAPLAIIAVCTSTTNNVRKVNGFGQVVIALLLLTTLLSLLGYLIIQPNNWSSGHDLKESGLAEVREWSRVALRGSMFYLAAILGVKVAK